jgi:hypothetical protein
MDHRLSGSVFTTGFSRSLRVLAMLGLAASLWGCQGPDSSFNPRLPTAPSPTAAPGPAYSLSGVVSEKTPDGVVPLAGAQVREARSGRQAISDGSGFYEITGLTLPSIAVIAAKDGYVTRRLDVTVSANARVDLEVSPLELQTLSGVVFEILGAERVPIAGVSVYCDSCGSPFGHTFTETDAAGAFSFGWANNGPTRLLVSKDGYRLSTPGGSTGSIVAPVNGSTRFDIELVRH